MNALHVDIIDGIETFKGYGYRKAVRWRERAKIMIPLLSLLSDILPVGMNMLLELPY